MADEFDLSAISGNLVTYIKSLETRIASLERRLSDANPQSDLNGSPEIRSGLIVAGEGDPVGDGDPLTGMAWVYPPVTVNGVEYNMVGMEAGVLKFGVRASDGSLTSASEIVLLNDEGITVEVTSNYQDTRAYTFKDVSGNVIGGMYSYLNASAINFVKIETASTAARSSNLLLRAVSPSGYSSGTTLSSGAGEVEDTAILQVVKSSAGVHSIELNAGKYFYIDTHVWGSDGTTPIATFDSTNLRLGINNSSPASALDVTGTIKTDGLKLFGITSINTASWTPSFTNLTVGNGTLTAKYAVIGSVVHAWVSLVFGTTTSITVAGPVSCSIPIGNLPITNVPIGHALLVDSGTANLLGRIFSSTGTTISINADSVYGSLIVPLGLTSTSPFTWTTGDTINLSFSYPLT